MDIKPAIVFACDETYFTEHGAAFCKSAVANNNKVVGYVFPNLSKGYDGSRLEEKQDFINTMENIHRLNFRENGIIQVVDYFSMQGIFNGLEISDPKALYASMRFLLLPAIIERVNAQALLILDVDSIIRKEIKIPSEYEIGLFLRENNHIGVNEYERIGMKVAAGAVYLKPSAKEFAMDVHKKILENPIQWFSDQHAIYSTYTANRTKYKTIAFNNNFLDWDFKDDTAIWTGKGDRKKDNKLYVTEKEKWEKL